MTPAAVHVPLAACSPGDTCPGHCLLFHFSADFPHAVHPLIQLPRLLGAAEWFQPDLTARWKFPRCYYSPIYTKIIRESPSLVSPTREKLSSQPCLAHYLACHWPSSHRRLESAKAACSAAGSELGTAWDAAWDDGGAGEGLRESRRLEMWWGMEKRSIGRPSLRGAEQILL